MYKKISILLFVSAIILGCSSISDNYTPTKTDVEDFETAYIKRFSLGTKASINNGIQLIGYKTITYKGKEAQIAMSIWKEYENDIERAGYYLISGASVRIYFPLTNAIVLSDKGKIVADDNGILKFQNDGNLSRLRIVGRAATEKSIKTNFSKFIKPATIYKEDSVIFFDLGNKSFSCCEKISIDGTKKAGEEENQNISCIANHLPYSNCSTAFSLYQGRCTLRTDRCMDYNGFGTDCKGSHLYFLGSDCSVALAEGHCWNELMKLIIAVKRNFTKMIVACRIKSPECQ